MSYFVTPQASSGQIAGAINYILANLNTNVNPNFTTGIVNSTSTTATGPNGQTTAYLYRYLDVAYADNGSGSVNFSSSPLSTNKFYGLRNTNSSVYSSNPADYVWYQINGTFSGGNLIWYQTFGGLQINLVVATSQPTPAYQNPITATAIDLTQVSTATNLQGRSAYAVTSTTLGGTPATYTTTGNATFPPDNTWGGSEHWVANPPSYTAGQNVYQIDGIYNPANNLTLWAAPYLATLKVGNLSAINANLGTITAGTLNAVTVNSSTINAGTTPPVIDYTNHTISSGAGALINPNGTFAMGSTSSNIVDDGSGVYLNGFVIAANNNSSSISIPFYPSYATLIPSSKFVITKLSNVVIGLNATLVCESESATVSPYAVFAEISIVLYNTNTNVYTTLQNFYASSALYKVTSSNPIFTQADFPLSFHNIYNANTTQLAVGTYILYAQGLQMTFYDSSGNAVSAGGTGSGMALSQANAYWYQIG